MSAETFLMSSLPLVLIAFWSVFCVWAGFRMGRQVVIPGEPQLPKPVLKDQKVDIDNTHDDPWEAAMHDLPEERITGDLQ